MPIAYVLKCDKIPGVRYDDPRLKQHLDNISRYLKESAKFDQYLPGFTLPPDQVADFYQVTENRLMHKNQAEYLRYLFKEIQEDRIS